MAAKQPRTPLLQLHALSRQTIAVFYALLVVRPEGATYHGLRALLGLRTDSGVRQVVRAAKNSGVVKVLHVHDGRGAKAVVRLTDEARATAKKFNLWTQETQK